MRDYIQGRRGNQVKPLLLLMISAALVVLLGKYLLGGDLIGPSMQAGYTQPAGTGVDGNAAAAASAKNFALVKDWINAHLTAFTLLLLPFEAGAFWLAFKGRGLNYPEWLVISAFLTVQTFIFMAAAVLVQRWVPSAQTWIMPLTFFYLVFSLAQYFKGYPRWKTVLRALLGFIIFMAANYLLSATAAGVLLSMSMHG